MIKNITKLLVLGLFCVSFMQAGENDLGNRYTFYTPDNKVLGSVSKEVIYNLSELLGKSEKFKDKSSFVIDIEKEDSEYSYLPPQAWDLVLQYLRAYEEDSTGAIMDSLQKMKSSEYALYLLRFSWMYKFKELQKNLARSLLKGWKQLSDKMSLEDLVEDYLGDKKEFREIVSFFNPIWFNSLCNKFENSETIIVDNDPISAILLNNKIVVTENIFEKIKLYDIQAGKDIITHKDTVDSVAIDDKFVVLGSSDGKVMLYDITTSTIKDIITHKDTVDSVAIDGNFVVSGSYDGTVKLYDINSGEVKNIITYGSTPPYVAIHNNTVALGYFDGRVILYDIATSTIKDIITHSEGIGSVSLNDKIVVAKSIKGIVKLYDRANGKVKDIQDRVISVALNDEFVVFNLYGGRVMLHNISNGNQLMIGGNEKVRAVAINNNFVALGSSDGKVMLYDIARRILKNITTDNEAVLIVAISDNFIAYRSGSKVVKLFRLLEGMDDAAYFKALEKVV